MSQLRLDAPLSQSPVKPSPERDRADFEALDVDHSHEISQEEFFAYGDGFALTGAAREAYEQKRVARFERYDADASGGLSRDEFLAGRQADRAGKQRQVAEPAGLGQLLKGVFAWMTGR